MAASTVSVSLLLADWSDIVLGASPVEDGDTGITVEASHRDHTQVGRSLTSGLGNAD